MSNLTFFHIVCILVIVYCASFCEGRGSIRDHCHNKCNDDDECYKNCVEWAFNPWHIAGIVLAIVGIIIFITCCMIVFKDYLNNRFCYLIMCPFALVLSAIWCLFCCWCPFCPEFLKNPIKRFSKTKPEALLWKLEDTSLKNKQKNWKSDDEWEFTNHSQSTILIKNLSKNKILTLDDYGLNVDLKAMEIDQDEELNQQWRIGPMDEDGYFNLINNSTKNMLISRGRNNFDILDPEKDTMDVDSEANVDATTLMMVQS